MLLMSLTGLDFSQQSVFETGVEPINHFRAKLNAGYLTQAGDVQYGKQCIQLITGSLVSIEVNDIAVDIFNNCFEDSRCLRVRHAEVGTVTSFMSVAVFVKI